MIKKLLLIAAAALLIASCSTQTFTMRGNSDKPTTNRMQPFFIYGIGQTKTINAAKVCGGVNKVVKVEVQQTFLNGFLSALTGGIFSPRQARVYCSR
jgi:hypothetical protein